MLHLLHYGVHSQQLKFAYNQFHKHYTDIKKREHSTQYEDIYKDILDIIVFEHKECLDLASERLKKLNFRVEIPAFFQPIINDLKCRIEKTKDTKTNYSSNRNFYSRMNSRRIFLAEFRFWE